KTGERNHLEQYAHLPGIDEPCYARGDRLPLRRRGALEQPLAPFANAELEQELALGEGAMGSKPERGCSPLQFSEVHMGSKIGIPRIGEWIGKAVAAHRLQCVAESELGVAIVDDESCERVAASAASKLAKQSV